MAVVLAFRVAIMVLGSSGGYKLWRYIQGPSLDTPLRYSDKALDWLRDHTKSDEAISELLTAENDYPVSVTTVSGDFEVRRIQVEFSVSGPAVLEEDQRVITFHAIKLSGGQPISTWDPGDFDTLNTAFYTWWSTIKPWYSTGLIYTGQKYYKAGPAIVPPQPPVHESTQSEPGTCTLENMPPQVAISCTEIALQKKNWGRFYFPAPCIRKVDQVAALTAAGRPTTNIMTELADATDALYETALTANLPFCVYKPLLAANRPTGNPPAPSELPERPAQATVVEKIQIDDVYDVIRRRRWDNPTLRLQRQIGSAAALTVSAASQAEESLEAPLDAQTP